MKEIIIKEQDSNQRVDKYIKKMLPNAPLSLIYKTFRKKDIKINNKWVKENYILQEGDVLRIFLKDELFEEKVEIDLSEIKPNFEIVYEDENFIFINKDKNLLVHGDDKENKYTLNNMILSYLIKKGEYNPKDDNFKPGVIHRLDRNTSGLIIAAKNFLASKEGMEIFKYHENIEKKYIALTFNKAKEEDEIRLKLKKNEKTKIVTVDKKEGKEAITYYKKIDGNEEYSLLLVTLLTGRTHQIRVHLSRVNLPLVGDEKYGDFEKNKEFDEKYHYKKQFLHSYSMSFKNIKGRLSYLNNKTFIAPLKESDISLLNKLNLKIK